LKTVIIIPTYNERESITALISLIRAYYPDLDIMVIDDNSPDMTYRMVKEISEEDPRVKLILRDKREGLGRALLAGYRYGLDNGYQRLIQIDADLSHPPENIELILKGLESSGLVIASRNITNAGFKDCPLSRVFLSRLANLLASNALGLKVKDVTSGFRGFSIELISYILKENPISKGYIIQVETTLYAKRCGCGIKEVPFIYRDRKRGDSKMDIKEVLTSTITLLKLILKRYN
jgi:dolichol-phosphate mannosyltransferase